MYCYYRIIEIPVFLSINFFSESKSREKQEQEEKMISLKFSKPLNHVPHLFLFNKVSL